MRRPFSARDELLLLRLRGLRCVSRFVRAVFIAATSARIGLARRDRQRPVLENPFARIVERALSFRGDESWSPRQQLRGYASNRVQSIGCPWEHARWRVQYVCVFLRMRLYVRPMISNFLSAGMLFTLLPALATQVCSCSALVFRRSRASSCLADRLFE